VQFSQYDGVNRWTQMALEMFGDPQLSLPRHAGHDLALSAPSTVNVGGGGIPVHVTEDGVAKPGVIVTAYRDAEGIVTATTDAQGDAVLPFVALAPGEVSITARQDGSPVQVDSVEATANSGVDGPSVPRFTFAAPSPNPSSGVVFFHWSVPAELAESPAKLTLHDLAGRVVRTLESPAGATSARTATWDGRDASGGRLAPGLYVARLVVGGQALKRPLIRTR
ncbi:MAG TPA: FlgD immunoglobulin-like domain containing protein, partial [Verrucomicrobiae bacterium]|nr:FlgD immunoglobulin-like domain containing protein [Verrucomicrobiae bacterium]